MKKDIRNIRITAINKDTTPFPQHRLLEETDDDSSESDFYAVELQADAEEGQTAEELAASANQL